MSGIAYVMVNALAKLETDLFTKFRIAFRAIHQRELFHFAVEYMSTKSRIALTGRARDRKPPGTPPRPCVEVFEPFSLTSKNKNLCGEQN
jgi:hypothetical protein